MEESLLALETKDINDLKGRVWVESKKIWKLAFPAMLSRMGQYGMFVVTQVFMGHIGELELAAYALIQIIAVRFAYGILVGMSSANSTMSGQAFGAKQYHMLGIYLQRSWIISFTTATLLMPVFIFSTPMFKLIGQEEDIASKAGNISTWFIPIIYSYAFTFNMQQFLQSQHKNMIIGWLSAASFALHVLLSWIFVTKLNLGISGAMGAMIIASWLVTIALFLYIFGSWCPDTWRGFTLAAFADLFPAVKLSISSGVMMCLELWYNAVIVLLAGYLKNATIEISAFSICVNIIAWELTLCLGFVVACGVRVSNELGSGNAKAATFSIKVILTTAILMGVLFWIICLVLGNRIGYIFTSDELVAETVSSLSVLLAFSVFLNSGQAILTGAAIGSGRQTTVAYINICSYYLVGVPVGVLLGYVANLKIKGLWIGMIVGVVIQSLVLGYMTSTTDWNEQVNKASERLNRFKRPLEESNSNYNIVNE